MGHTTGFETIKNLIGLTPSVFLARPAQHQQQRFDPISIHSGTDEARWLVLYNSQRQQFPPLRLAFLLYYSDINLSRREICVILSCKRWRCSSSTSNDSHESCQRERELRSWLLILCIQWLGINRKSRSNQNRAPFWIGEKKKANEY